MDESQMSALWRSWEQTDLDELSDSELAAMHDKLLHWRKRAEALEQEISSERVNRLWKQLPYEEMREIRVLLKGARLTPPMLKAYPELGHLLLLLDVDQPEVVSLWVKMAPEMRAKRIQDFRKAMSLHDVKRTTTSWEDEKESIVLAYEIFGLSQQASWADVRRAYRDMAATHHPDKGGDPRVFQAFQKAYKILESRYI